MDVEALSLWFPISADRKMVHIDALSRQISYVGSLPLKCELEFRQLQNNRFKTITTELEFKDDDKWWGIFFSVRNTTNRISANFFRSSNVKRDASVCILKSLFDFFATKSLFLYLFLYDVDSAYWYTRCVPKVMRMIKKNFLLKIYSITSDF